MSNLPVTTTGIRPIAGYEKFYSVSNDGRVWSHPKTLKNGRIKPGRWLTQCKTKDGYLFEHLPQYQGTWDGHDTPEKYRRLAAIDAEIAKERDGK